MAMPSKLININAYVDGGGFLGIVSELEEPKLAIATEDLRAGGMPGTVKVDLGLEAMEASFTMAGHVAELQRKFGTTRVDGVRVRFVGAYRADNGLPAQQVEVVMGGRFEEIDLGSAKPGDDTEHKYKVAVAYYRRVVAGRTEIEIDMVNGVFIVDGVDRYAEIMAALA